MMISKLLPQGVWLNDLKVTYTDTVIKETVKGTGKGVGKGVGKEGGKETGKQAKSRSPSLPKMATKMAIYFDGFAFHSNTNEQIRLIDQFLAELKKNDDFTAIFKIVNLITAQSQTINNYNVTYFKIICE